MKKISLIFAALAFAVLFIPVVWDSITPNTYTEIINAPAENSEPVASTPKPRTFCSEVGRRAADIATKYHLDKLDQAHAIYPKADDSDELKTVTIELLAAIEDRPIRTGYDDRLEAINGFSEGVRIACRTSGQDELPVRRGSP